MYYLVIILFAVAWIMLSIIRNYVQTKSPISHKYLNHGKIVPTQKWFKFNNRSNINYIRFYSTKPSLDLPPLPVKFYDDAFSVQASPARACARWVWPLSPPACAGGEGARKLIIKDNKNKSGIYKWTNKLTNDIYIGQSSSEERLTCPQPKDDVNNFYEWFTGLTDGEGSFNISIRNTQNFSFSFEITMHIDEEDLLKFIQQTLEVGKVSLSGNTARFSVNRREDIANIISIFIKYPLQSTKYLNFLSFKKAFELYGSSSRKSQELFEEISKIKANMNTLRTDFSEMETRKFSITPYWVLGFVEGEGSFTVAKRDYTLLFILAQSAKDLRLMEEVQNFFLSICNDQFYGKYVNEGVRLYRDTKSNTDAVYVSIGREDIITKIIIPFFDSLSWHSKKEKDYQDWKTILRLKQLGLHYTDEGIRVINLILNQMNLKRLSSSNSVKVDKESLNKSSFAVNLLNGPSNIETHEDGRIFVKSLNRYFNQAARDKIQVEVKDESGLTVNIFDSITSCAKYYNVSRSSLRLRRKLKNNQLATINVKDTTYRVHISTVAEENQTSVASCSAAGDTKSSEDPPALNSSDKVDSNEYPPALNSSGKVDSCSQVFYSLMTQAHSQGSKQKNNSSNIQSPIYVSEKCSKEGFKVIGCFHSAKKIARILGTSANEIIKLKNSGEIYKIRYKFT